MLASCNFVWLLLKSVKDALYVGADEALEPLPDELLEPLPDELLEPLPELAFL